jgi:hypothetical protein
MTSTPKSLKRKSERKHGARHDFNVTICCYLVLWQGYVRPAQTLYVSLFHRQGSGYSLICVVKPMPRFFFDFAIDIRLRMAPNTNVILPPALLLPV